VAHVQTLIFSLECLLPPPAVFPKRCSSRRSLSFLLPCPISRFSLCSRLAAPVLVSVQVPVNSTRFRYRARTGLAPLDSFPPRHSSPTRTRALVPVNSTRFRYRARTGLAPLDSFLAMDLHSHLSLLALFLCLSNSARELPSHIVGKN
jgi:hypothetical protein